MGPGITLAGCPTLVWGAMGDSESIFIVFNPDMSIGRTSVARYALIGLLVVSVTPQGLGRVLAFGLALVCHGQPKWHEAR